MGSKLASMNSGRRINSWKEIAAFFGRDERTVKRWEKERGLPVHRIPGGSRGSVFAFEAELTTWLANRKQTDRNDAPESTHTSSLKSPSGADSTEAVSRPPSRRLQRPIRWLAAALAPFVLIAILIGFRHVLFAARSHAASKPDPRFTAEASREAHDLYLQGRFYWNQRTPEGLTQSVDYFTKATERDPSFALGYAGLADAYNLLREYTSTPGSEAFPLAKAAAHKAVELDDSLPEGHRALAFVSFNWDWDVATADREYRRALALRPTDVETHHWYATMLMEAARHPQDVEEIERARQLDPSSRSIAADRGLILYCAGRIQEGFSALQALEKAEPEWTAPHSYLSSMYFEQKQYEQSFTESRILDKLSGSDATQVSRNEKIFKEHGETPLLQAVLAERLDDFEKGRGDAFAVAISYANLGRTRESLEYLERAYQRHEYVLISLRNNPAFRSFSGVPEFEALSKRLGLVPGKTS